MIQRQRKKMEREVNILPRLSQNEGVLPSLYLQTIYKPVKEMNG